MNINQKGFVNIALVVAIIAVLVGTVGYFAFVKESEPITQQTTPTPVQTETSASQTPTPNNEPAGQFDGSLRKESDNSWSLMSFGKYSTAFPLQFTSSSICVIGPDEGPCLTLQSNFNKGGPSLNLGGDNVNVDGNKQGNTIMVSKLILKDNFVMNGNLVESTSASGQKMWSLVYQPPVCDSVNQDPNRPTNTIPLKFDEKSFCGDTGQMKCSLYTFHQNDWVFMRGIKYKGVLIVRMLTVPAKAPPTLPR